MTPGWNRRTVRTPPVEAHRWCDRPASTGTAAVPVCSNQAGVPPRIHLANSLPRDRILPIEKFILDKRKTARRANEVIKEVAFQRPPERAWAAFDKVGRRSTLFIALASMAVYLRMEAGRVADIRLALNRVKGKVPERATKTESFLKGKELNDGVLDEAREILASELRLTSDFRASAEYRVEVQKALLRRLLNYCRRRIAEGWP